MHHELAGYDGDGPSNGCSSESSEPSIRVLVRCGMFVKTHTLVLVFVLRGIVMDRLPALLMTP